MPPNPFGPIWGLTISQLPRLRGSLKSDLVMRRMPSTQSSMNVKLRVCLPSPHISMSLVLVSTCGPAQGSLATAMNQKRNYPLDRGKAIIFEYF